MRRLITSRGLWLALAATVVAATVAVIVRSRRRSTRRPPAQQDGAPLPAQVESGSVARWPPVPILGTPTAEDLERYAAEPSIFDRPAVGMIFGGGRKREPLDDATRRRLTRWGIAGLALCLLAVGSQALESVTFSKDGGVETTEEIWHQDEPCIAGVCWAPEIEQAPAPDDGDYSEPVKYVETQEPVPASQPSLDADCRPESRNPRVRKLDAKATRAVNRQWQRIEAWLKAHAPRSYRTLGKPGKAESIAAAEAQTGLRFPDDLRASLLRHDGAAVVDDTWAFGFLGNWSLSLQGIRDTWRGLCEIDDEDEEEPADPRSDWWDGRMLPFGADGMGNHLVIDSVKHDVGETDHEGSMSFTPGGAHIRSYYALLKATADAMENGGSIGYWKPRTVAGELDWDVRD
ncbi:SMI1/KNR4 family protein [Nonomuraea sp. NEAU-A123]|uniref:SMI1/KNR4 family protein n=1 Tax=Nonomuraea sp. NEAU-A123 TaxID=2839649 RepID=UPI001BE4556F|nr:SMI1/KNR4 family protein [Nonomuraea sp. NEAU-A123]MBT2227285.1 SMI1/KNR4 family protein [Nonomuraea sp. NEAU-A123]